MEPFAFTKLGGKRRPVDKRDFEGRIAVPVPRPAVFMQDKAWSAPIYFQGQRPACGAHAGIWLALLLQSYRGGAPNYTPRFTWVDVKQNGIDRNPSDGTDMRSIFQSLKNTGVDDFLPLGNDVSLSDVQYAAPTAILAPMFENAKTKLIDAYTFADASSFDDLKQKIYEEKGVLLLMQVGASMWTAPSGSVSWNEKDILPLRPPSPVVDGHFVVAHSYDENYVYFANSWGTTWGRGGHGYFGEDYLPSILEVGTATLPPAPAVVSVSSSSLVVDQTPPPFAPAQTGWILRLISAIFWFFHNLLF